MTNFFRTEHLSMGSRFKSSEISGYLHGYRLVFWLPPCFHYLFLTTFLKLTPFGLPKFSSSWKYVFSFCFGKSSVKFEVFLGSDTFDSEVIIHLLPFAISTELENVYFCLNSIHFYKNS